MQPLERMINDLLEEGQADSHGEFTLDRDRAREKMRQFRLADPHRYVLELVQAAVLKGATDINFKIDTNDLWMSFDGQPFDVDDFENIYSAMFVTRRDPVTRARQQLALALNAAMALNPKFVRVQSSDGTNGALLLLHPDKEDEYGATELEEAGTKIHIHKRFRPGMIVQFFRSLTTFVGGLERQYLQWHCVIPVTVNDVETSIRIGPESLLGSVSIDSRTVSGEAGFYITPLSAPMVYLIQNGVWITTHSPKSLPQGFAAVVDGKSLKKDVSQTDFVSDSAYASLVSSLKQASWRSLGVVVDQLSSLPSELKEPATDLIRENLFVNHPKFKLNVEQTSPTALKLASVKLFKDLTGTKHSLRDVVKSFDEKKSITYVTVEIAPPPSEGKGTIVLKEKPDLRFMRHIFGKGLSDITKQLLREAAKEEKRQRWLTRKVPVRLLSGADLFRFRFETELVYGELGVSQRNQGKCWFHLIKSGCLLSTLQLSLPLPINAALEADFEPNNDYSGVLQNKKLARILWSMLGQLESFHVALAATMRSTGARLNDERARIRILQYLVNVHDPKFVRVFYVPFRIAWKSTPMGSKKMGPTPFAPQLGTRTGKPTDHPLTRVPLFRTVSGRWTTLTDLSALRPIKVLDRSFELHDSDNVLVGDNTVAVNELERSAMTTLFAASRVRDAAPELLFERAKRQHLEKPLHSANLKSPAWLAKVPIQGEEMEGELGVGASIPTKTTLSPTTVTVLWQNRTFVKLDVVLPIDGHAIVNSDRFTPNADWTGLADEQACDALLDALGQASLGLVERWVQQFRDGRDRHDCLKAAAALVPSPSFHRAFQALDARFAAEEAHSEYLKLIFLACGHTDVETALDLLHEQRQLPCAEAVLELLKQPDQPDAAAKRRVEMSGFSEWFRAIRESGSDEHVPVLPILRPIPLFNTLSGDLVSFDGLASELSQHGAIGFVCPNEVKSWRHRPQRRVLVLNDRELDVLWRVFGINSTEDLSDWLDETDHLEQFRKHSKTQTIKLEVGQALLTVPLKTEDPAIEGEVGLSLAHRTSAKATATVQFCRERRPVVVKQFDWPYALVAIVNDDQLEVNSDFTDMKAGPRQKVILDILSNHIDPLMAALAARWKRLGDVERSVGWNHGLSYLAEQQVWITGVDQFGFKNKTLRFFARRKQLRRCDDKLCSLSDLRDCYQRYGSVFTLSVSPHKPAAQPDRIVIVPTRFERELLNRIFPNVVDFTKKWQLEQAAAKRLQNAPAPPAIDDLKTLQRCRVRKNSLKGHLFLPLPVNLENKVKLVRSGKTVEERSIAPVPCGGIVEVPASHISENWDRIELTKEQTAYLKDRCASLYAHLADRISKYQRDRVDADMEAAEEYLAQCVVNLHKTAHLLPKRRLEKVWNRMKRRLNSIPLFQIQNGRYLNLNQVLNTRPSELSHLELWRTEPDPVGRPDTGSAKVLRTKRAPLKSRISSLLDELRVPGGPEIEVQKERKTEPEMEPEPETPPPPPGRLLLEALFEELRRVRSPQLSLLGEEHLAQFDTSDVPSTIPISYDCGQFFLHLGHPLVTYVLDNFEVDATALSFLTSLAFSAINAALREVTDEDERAFHRHLTDYVLSGHES